MPPSRPYWKGYLKLSLVSCPIAVYSASSASERIAFRQINKQTGNRLKQQLVDEGTGDIVTAENKGRGYPIDKDTFLLIDDGELDAIAIESSQTIDIDSFVPRAQIDERYFETPYYIVPNDRVGQDAFAVIRDAMRGKEMVALGRIVIAKRERVIMLQAWDKGIVGTTLRYAYEVRDASAFFDDVPSIKISPDMLNLAEHILESKRADFDPSQFRDRYEEAVVEMVQSKQAGMIAPKGKAAAAKADNVVDLMEALKRSLGQPVSKPADKIKIKKPRKASLGQREMLLPIAGKGPAKAAASPAATTKTSSRSTTGRRAG